VADPAAVWTAPTPAQLKVAAGVQEPIDADADSVSAAYVRRNRATASSVGSKRSAAAAGVEAVAVARPSQAALRSPQVAPLYSLWEEMSGRDMFRTAAARTATLAGTGSIRSVRLASLAAAAASATPTAAAAASASMRSVSSAVGKGGKSGTGGSEKDKAAAKRAGPSPSPSPAPAAAAGVAAGPSVAFAVPASPSASVRSRGMRSPASAAAADDNVPLDDPALGSPLPRIPELSAVGSDGEEDARSTTSRSGSRSGSVDGGRDADGEEEGGGAIAASGGEGGDEVGRS